MHTTYLHCIIIVLSSFRLSVSLIPAHDSSWQVQNNVQGNLEAEQLHLALVHTVIDKQPHSMSLKYLGGVNIDLKGYCDELK